MPRNTAPTLVGVTSSVTFAENTVNAAPQIIDASVVFQDLDGNFSGGTLSITGLLAEDRIGIFNQGPGAGQIGVSGANVTYGGVTIGSFTGGIGSAFNITFNAAATSAAIDALVQNLTYADVSDTPTASRTLTLDITDSTGGHLSGFSSFSQVSGASSPVNNLPTDQVGHASFDDIDGDGDLDAYVSGYNSYVSGPHALGAYRNDGSGNFTAITSPLPDIQYGAIAFLDIDGDGDLDAVVGGGPIQVHLRLFTRNGNNFTEVPDGSNPFFQSNVVDYGDKAVPAAADVDSDGLTDLVWTSSDGDLHYFHHNANHTFTELTGASNPFNSIHLVSGFTTKNITFADVDGDGDPDLVASVGTTIQYFRNNAGAFAEQTGAFDAQGNGNPFNGVTSAFGPLAPVFADFDGDGDGELVIAQSGAPYLFFQNSGTHGRKITINVTPESDNTAPVLDLNGGAGGTSATLAYTENAVSAIAPLATVADGDSPNFDTGTLTISFTANGAAEDRLTIISTGTGAGQISVAGAAVSYQGTQIGTFTGGTNGSTPLVITLNASATPTATQALAEAIAYSDVSNAPSTAARTVQFVLTDGDGGTSAAVTATINVTAVNDAPVNTVPANGTISGAEDSSFAITGMHVSDVDAAFVTVYLAATHGTLIVSATVPGGATTIGGNGSATVTIFGTPSQIETTLSNATAVQFHGDADYSGTAQITILTNDGGSSGIDPGTSGGADDEQDADTFTINVTAVNDAPVLDLDADDSSGATAGDYATSYTEGGVAAAVADSDVSITDPDAGDSITSATISLSDLEPGDELNVTGSLPGSIIASGAGTGTIVLSGTGTRAQYQTALTQIVYSSTSDDPTVGGTHDTRSIGIIVNDGTVNSVVTTATVTIMAIDDPAVAQPDAFTLTEASTIVAGNLFASNGSGADGDPDGPPLAISAVNGGANVGAQITLLSGALLTVNANGTFDYNPNGAFNDTPTAGSSASNTPGHDSFTYTLAGGDTTTVSLTITGLDTNDTLRGTGGNDSLSGGVGDDRYFVDQPGDLVLETSGQGYDRVLASVSYVLAAGSEIEKLTTSDSFATTPIDLTGNELGQYLFGNAGANRLDGAGGADVMVGLGGDDRYYIDTATDRVIEAAGEGYDRVLSAVSWTLQPDSYVDKITTTDNFATTAINLTGNNLGQYMFGNAGANTLDGGGGGDVMAGLEGDDRYIIRDAADRVLESAGGGYDRALAAVSWTLQPDSQVEKITTIDNLSVAAIDLTGNNLGQYLYGNAGDNVLDGKLGNDILYGLGGADTFQFSTVTGANNVDRIVDFVTGVDKIALDDFIFVGLASGALPASAFYVGSAAHDADDRIIYNQTTGALYFDYDGNGIGTAIQFATLDGVPILAASDIMVI